MPYSESVPDETKRVGKHSWTRTMLIVLVIGGLGVAGYAYVRTNFPEYFSDTTVYSVAYEKPKNWKEEPPGPFTLFVYRHPEGQGVIRASLNEVQSNTNPTPELDTDGVARHLMDVTRRNMPDWKAERLPDITSSSERFSLVKRTKVARTVYTAFCAKGNSTLVISLSASGKDTEKLEDLLPVYLGVIESVRLTPKKVENYD